MDKDMRKNNPVILTIVGFFVITAIIILIYIIYTLAQTNPYGNEIRIRNFDSYYGETPESTKESLYANLYNTVAENLENTENDLDVEAVIREGSAEKEYNKDLNIHVGKFVVDIEDINQSFAGYFEWSDDADNINYSGYTALFTCLPEDKLIYGPFDCKDIFSDDLNTRFPITRSLPLTVEYYSNNYSDYVKYTIDYSIENDTSIMLKIIDYTGGNEQNARKKIGELGYDVEKFEIVYSDQSQMDQWPYVGD